MAAGVPARHQLTGLVGGLQFPAQVSLTVRWLGRFPSPAPSMARVRRRCAADALDGARDRYAPLL